MINTMVFADSIPVRAPFYRILAPWVMNIDANLFIIVVIILIKWLLVKNSDEIDPR